VLPLLAIAYLYWQWQNRRDRDIPPAEDLPDAGGPDWLPLPELAISGSSLLAPDDLRAAIWGVERFVSEDETERIDVNRTVDATADAGGIPSLRFSHAIYPREVWLWHDTLTQDSSVAQVIEEVEHSLTRAGLPVRVGTFVDIPELICWDEGQEWSPLVLEGHRQHALVLIFTDGVGMQLAADDDVMRGALARLLHGFSEWPRLAFVDVSDGAQGLSAQLQRYGVACISLEAIPAFLGAGSMQQTAKRHIDSQLTGDLRAWAAATALSPEPVDTETAFALREHLKLRVPSWGFRTLLSAAHGWDAHLAWSSTVRANLLNWLTRCSIDHTGGIVEKSPLALALDYWIERYEKANVSRTARQNSLLPWQRSAAQHRMRMEIALLSLWRQPVEAVKTLYGLRADQKIREEIEERLSVLADWDQWREPQPGQIYLPWRAATQPAVVRWMLSELGFGGRKGQGRLVMPLKLSLTFGLCAGLAAIALLTTVWRLAVPVPPVIEPFLPAALQAVVIQEHHRTGPNTYQVTIGTPKHVEVQKGVAARSTVQVSWQWKPDDNVEKLGQSQLWHAGTLPQPIRACEPGWPRRSLVVIAAPPDHKPARQLAIQLLDRGSADVVLIGTDWEKHANQLLQVDISMTRADQLIVIAPPGADVPTLDFQGAYGVVQSSNFGDLIARLDFPEEEGNRAAIRPLQDVWTHVRAQGQPLLRGGPEKTMRQDNHLTFVTVCGGTFTMGSTEFDNEKPPHPVTLSPFEINQTEITFQQYPQPWKDDPGNFVLPLVKMDWQTARDYCDNYDDHDYDYALPTEAEWEYAARGGSVTRWSFGDDEAQLGNYAWFRGNSDGRSNPVKTRLPNPLGLYDMHGNVYEWVEDCYDGRAYQDRSTLIVNPLVNRLRCQYRVLRGGAWDDDPWYLRSAFRFGDGPGDRDDGIGFRCVRRPRRQP
jgi:formylglycine-generating enzyme required for sulfatase activity